MQAVLLMCYRVSETGCKARVTRPPEIIRVEKPGKGVEKPECVLNLTDITLLCYNKSLNYTQTGKLWRK